VNDAEFEPSYWWEEAWAGIEARRARAVPRGRARNVLMFLGDGRSLPTVAAARALLGQRQGRSGEEAHLYFEQFPSIGLAKVSVSIYSYNQS
jgi:alkaline phosphatase